MPSVTGSAHRKSDKQFRDILRVVGKERDANGIRKLRLVANSMYQEAINGNVAAQTAIRDTLDGKPAQAVELDVQVQVTKIEYTVIEPAVFTITPESMVIENADESTG